MTAHRTPIGALFDLVAEGASGELVSVSRSCELHLYLQAGRIAWATDSTQPFAFSRHLLEHTTITKETFNEVLESCRRDRLPLGETLIEWQVATLEQIRAALQHQIIGALASLRECSQERTIFLERQRQFASYDTKLTFAAADLLGPDGARRNEPEQHQERSALDILDRIRAAIPAPAWMELLDGNVALGRQPPGDDQLVPHRIVNHTVLDGVDLVALRTGRGTVIGVVLPEQSHTVWVRLEVETSFGSTLSALCQLANIEQPATPATTESWSRSSAVHSSGDTDRSGGGAELHTLRTFMDRAPEIEGALLIQGGEQVCAASRRNVDMGWMKGIARRREVVLDVLLSEPAETDALEDLGYRLKSLVTGEERAWCFGAELPSEPKRTLWIFTDRLTAQGLGWAYLTSLSRQLAAITTNELSTSVAGAAE